MHDSGEGAGGEKPPGGEGTSEKLSFQDKLMMEGRPPPRQVNLIEQGTMKMGYENDNDILPLVTVDPTVFKEMFAQ